MAAKRSENFLMHTPTVVHDAAIPPSVRHIRVVLDGHHDNFVTDIARVEREVRFCPTLQRLEQLENLQVVVSLRAEQEGNLTSYEERMQPAAKALREALPNALPNGLVEVLYIEPEQLQCA